MTSEVAGTSTSEWQCLHCTTLNKPEHVNCTSCLVRRTGAPKLKEEDLIRHTVVDKVKNWLFPRERTCLKCPTKANSLYCPQCADEGAAGAVCGKYRLPMEVDFDQYDMVASSKFDNNPRDDPTPHSIPGPNSTPHQDREWQLQATHYNSNHGRRDSNGFIAHSHRWISRTSSMLQESVTSADDLVSGDSRHCWQCSFCGVINFTCYDGGRCYVCRIGQRLAHSSSCSLLHPAPHRTDAPATNLDQSVPPPSLIRNHHTSLDSPEPSSKPAIYRTGHGGSVSIIDGASKGPRERPADLRYAPPHQPHRGESHPCTDQYTPSMVVKRLDDSHQADLSYQHICQYCQEHGEPFTDPDFPPAHRSLSRSASFKNFQWLRPGDIQDPNWSTAWTLFRDPVPEDIEQGVLGNCWVLSALSVVAECRSLLEVIVLTQQYSPKVGAYLLRLCKDGTWTNVVVDDTLPCHKDGTLAFSKAGRKQLWVPLIEKALAKLYGCYEALNSGTVLSGLSTLTGLPCDKINLHSSLEASSVCDHDDADPDFVWAQLLSYRESRCPMGACCGGHRSVDYKKVGLEENHAYSILDVCSVELESESVRLLRLRNPWGRTNWQGRWSRNDLVWERNPWLKQLFHYEADQQGFFWIEFTDFIQYFWEVDVCKYREDWYSTRMPGQLVAGVPQEVLAFTLNSNTELDISIYQTSNRDCSTSLLVDLAVLVVQYSPDQDGVVSLPLPSSLVLASGCQRQSVVTCSGFLEQGHYAILPLSFTYWCCREVLYHPHSLTRPGFLTEALFLLTNNRHILATPFPHMELSEVCVGTSCRVLVAKNSHQQNHFLVSCDASASYNVVSTRRGCGHLGLQISDSLPPNHRQVLLLLVQEKVEQPYKVSMKFHFYQSQGNGAGGWDACHSPTLHHNNQLLHSPRPFPN